MDNNWKNQNFFVALKNALNGIKYVFVQERNLKIQFVFAIIAILAGVILKINSIEWVLLTVVICMVLVCELFNTAIETIVNMITTEYNENAKIAKDIAAGAVTLSSISSVIIGIIMFLPKIFNII